MFIAFRKLAKPSRPLGNKYENWDKGPSVIGSLASNCVTENIYIGTSDLVPSDINIRYMMIIISVI